LTCPGIDRRTMIINPEPSIKRKGLLYIVATPIGNLEDITLRALRVLKEVRLIAAEDTRRTRHLLNAYQIDTPVTSLYEHNELKKGAALIAKVLAGHDLAYVSDAGTPGISDPGYLLIQEALAHCIEVRSIPGACAAVAALSISGLPMDSFTFHGFLPVKTGKRRQFVKSLENEATSMIFYESPKRLVVMLKDLLSILGDRRVVVVRELTKVYEEVIRGKLAEVIDTLRDRDLKGEITLIVAGKEKSALTHSEGDIWDLLSKYQERGTYSERDLIEKVAGELGVSRRIVYGLVVQAKG